MAMTSTATTNFSSTVTALVMQQLEPILAASKPHAAGDNFVRGTILKGHNQLTYTAYAKLAPNTAAHDRSGHRDRRADGLDVSVHRPRHAGVPAQPGRRRHAARCRTGCGLDRHLRPRHPRGRSLG